MTVLSTKDIIEILPFGRNKVLNLLQNGIIPSAKVGKTYITTDEILKNWITNNIGKQVY